MTARRPLIALTSRLALGEAGGIESAVGELAPRIAARRRDWDVRTVHAFTRSARWNHVPLLGDLVAAALLAARTRRCDLVVVNGAEYAWPRTLGRRARARTVVVWHGTRAGEVPALVPAMSPAVRVYHALETALQGAALGACGQLAVSETSRREIERAYGPQPRLAVVPNGAATRNLDAHRTSARTRRVAWIGTNAYKKGLDIALAACERVRAVHPDLELVVIGLAAGEVERLPGWVRATGRIPHAAALARLASADVFLATSRYEGCSVAAIEALALGVPVIAGPSVAWMIGDGGIAVEGFAPEAYAAALETAFAEPGRLAAMSAAARARAAHFDWDAAADAYAAEIARCLCGT